MNTRYEIFTFFSVGLLLFTYPTVRAQETAANATSASVEAGDRQFLLNLEKAEARKSPATREGAEVENPRAASVTPKFETYSTESPVSSGPAIKASSGSGNGRVKDAHKVTTTTETVSASVQRLHEQARRSRRGDSSQPVDAAAEPTPAVINGVAELPESADDGRVDDRGHVEDHRFFHRLFSHIFHRQPEGQ